MSTTEKTHQPRTRQRAALSCTQCRERKQKCNRAKDRPCNHCARRWPLVECVYESDGMRSNSKSREILSAGYNDESDSQRRGSFSDQERTGTPLDPSMTGLGVPGPSTSTSLAPRTLLTPGYLPSFQFSDYNNTQSHTGRNFRELSPATRQKLQTHSGASADISSIFLVDWPRPESEDFAQFNALKYGIDYIPDPMGVLQQNDVTRRNAELLHFFINHLLPFTSSVDGFSPSKEISSQWEIWMMTSPLVVHVSILAAAYFQATARGVDVEMSVDVITTRSELIRGINECLNGRDGPDGVSDEALVAVMGLSYLELVYSNRKSVMAHVSGLRSMINTRGGIEKIPEGVLKSLLARTDYQIASTFECPSFLHTPLPTPATLTRNNPKHLTPLLPSKTRFSDPSVLESLGLALEAGVLLHDMRFLISSILSLSSSPESSKKEIDAAKFLKTVNWISTRLNTASSPSKSEADYLLLTLQNTALIFTSAITSRKPLSQSCTDEMLKRLWGCMWRVSLMRWKEIPGVFLWVLLVVGPALGRVDNGEVSEEKKKMGGFVTGVCGGCLMEFEDGEGIEVVMSGWSKVQRWLGGVDDENEFDGKGKGSGKGKEKGGNGSSDGDVDNDEDDMMEEDE